MADVPQAAIDWIASGDTGMSSEAIWAHMAGSKMLPANGFGYAHPHDPADLGRCLRLLAKVPLWALRIPEMAEHAPAWAALVEHWDELAKLLAEELGEGWQPGYGKSAPRTYARMREILELVEARRG